MIKLRHWLNIIFISAALVLAWLLIAMLQKPVSYQWQVTKRYETTVKRLDRLRKIELAYKSIKGKYTDDLRKLLHLALHDSLTINQAVLPASNPLDSLSDNTIEIGKKSVLDSLFNGSARLLDDIIIVPNNLGETFDAATTFIIQGNDTIEAFQISVPYTVLYHNIPETYYQTHRFDTLRVGSLKNDSTNGSWE